MQVYGIDAVLRIVSHLAFIYLAFWSLRSLRIETFSDQCIIRKLEWQSYFFNFLGTLQVIFLRGYRFMPKSFR